MAGLVPAIHAALLQTRSFNQLHWKNLLCFMPLQRTRSLQRRERPSRGAAARSLAELIVRKIRPPNGAHTTGVAVFGLDAAVLRPDVGWRLRPSS